MDPTMRCKKPFTFKKVTVHLVKDKKLCKKSCSIGQCWYAVCAYHLIITLFEAKNCPYFMWARRRKMQTRHFQTILENHGYILISTSTVSSLATCQAHNHIWHFTHIKPASHTCEAVGEHQLDVHKLAPDFLPKHANLHMDTSLVREAGRYYRIDFWVLSFPVLGSSSSSQQNLVVGVWNEFGALA